MAIFNAETQAQKGAAIKHIEGKIKAPHVFARVSTLGGVARASIIIKVSLDRKATWPNGIFQNSRHFMISLGRNGVMEMFTKSYKIRHKAMRKSTVKNLADAVLKINKYISAVK